MISAIDALLDRITTYRLLLYVLLGYIACAALGSYLGWLAFAPQALLLSTALLVALCWAANTILARIFAVPTNIESALITGLILALILDPAQTANDVPLLGWAAILAMASKYILSINTKHIFNPSAIAVVITGFALGNPASWWVGTASMLPVTLIGGLLILRKTRQGEIAAWFLAAALTTVVGVSALQHLALTRELRLLLVESPLCFFGTIMLTEPLTMPPTRDHKRIYGILTGFLFVPQIHLGAVYSTPELALVMGNVYAYLVGPKQRVTLRLLKKHKLSPSIIDFAFTPSQRVAYAPGQYIECTLDVPQADARGNRRYFTLASSPTEEVVRLGVRFYRKGSSFKRALAALDGRTKLLGAQIAGDFTMPRDPKQKLVFIAGGIGITPFRSMIKYLLDTKQKRVIVVIYANQRAEEIVYKDILTEAEQQLGIKTIYTLTDTTALPAKWAGQVGKIDASMLRQAVPDFADRLFYLSGPPGMVRTYAATLRQMGVRRDRIKQDFFPGLT